MREVLQMHREGSLSESGTSCPLEYAVQGPLLGILQGALPSAGFGGGRRMLIHAVFRQGLKNWGGRCHS